MVEGSRRWLLVVGSLRSGGTERQAVALANELCRRGDSVVIGVIDGRYAPAYEVDPNVTVVELSRGGALGLFIAVFRLRRLSERATIVYSLLDAANLVAAVATLGRRTRLLWGVRASDIGPSHAAWLASRLCRPFSRRVDVLIGNATACIDFYSALGYRPRARRVVSNGIDTDRWRPDADARSGVRSELQLDDGQLLLGFIARVDRQKRHQLLLEAFAENRGAHLLLVGRGTDDPAGIVARTVRELGIGDRVSLLGERRDVPRLTAALDIACCASYYEGFPNSLLEAMASEVCCVATDVGGVREVLGDAGVVVVNPSANALSKALNLVASDRALRASLASAGRRRAVERFSIAAMVDATIAASSIEGCLP